MSKQSQESTISLYFYDQGIAQALVDLLNTLGFQADSVQSLTELEDADKVITEPLFFEALTSTQQSKCLLVGNKFTPDNLGCPVIRQPLTPGKIERGLREFLGHSFTS